MSCTFPYGNGRRVFWRTRKRLTWDPESPRKDTGPAEAAGTVAQGAQGRGHAWLLEEAASRLSQSCPSVGNVWRVPKAEDKSRKANLSPSSLRKPASRNVQHGALTRLPAAPRSLEGRQPEMQRRWRLGGREAGLVDALGPGVEQGRDRVLVRELQQPRSHAPVHRLQEGVGVCSRAAGHERCALCQDPGPPHPARGPGVPAPACQWRAGTKWSGASGTASGPLSWSSTCQL